MKWEARDVLPQTTGKENKTNTGVPPYPPSISEANSEENKAYRKAIEASLEELDTLMSRSVEADAEMEVFYQNHVTNQCKEMIFSNSYDNMGTYPECPFGKNPQQGIFPDGSPELCSWFLYQRFFPNPGHGSV